MRKVARFENSDPNFVADFDMNVEFGSMQIIDSKLCQGFGRTLFY